MPYLFPIALSIANWRIPSELLWLGQLPIIGTGLPILLIAGLAYLIALPIFVEETQKSANESSRELANSMIQALESMDGPKKDAAGPSVELQRKIHDGSTRPPTQQD